MIQQVDFYRLIALGDKADRVIAEREKKYLGIVGQIVNEPRYKGARLLQFRLHASGGIDDDTDRQPLLFKILNWNSGNAS